MQATLDTVRPEAQRPRPRSGRGRRLARLPVAIGLPMLMLFGGAGRWNWPEAWIYMALVAGGMLAAVVVFTTIQPGLVEERADRWREGKAWDKPIVLVVGVIGPASVQLVCGLDERFGWSAPVSPFVQFVAAAAFAAGIAVTAWAMAVNPFFSATVRIQTDRGHRPVAAGPYRIVRHPAYAAMIVGTAAGPLLLASLWALVPAAVVIAIFAIRTAMEDRTLLDELPGYVEYASRVRSRLVPGVW